MIDANSPTYLDALRRFNAAHEAVQADHATQAAAREWNDVGREAARMLEMSGQQFATQFVIRQGNKYKVRPYPLKGSIVALVGGAE